MSETDHGQGEFYLSGQRFSASRPAPGLYLVSTPIGNLKDITLRALETLAGADLILCEDTRHSARLLDHFLIRTPRTAVHEHNERARADSLVAQLQEGKAIALISDAGTPLVSDPGFPLVRAAREAGVDVFAVPGPSALLAGLASSGLPTDAFTFIGFLPPKQGARRNAIAQLADRTETLVFYESPRRLAACLADLAFVFGETREAVVAMELTKRFERHFSGTLAQLTATMDEGEQKGEAVIMVAGAHPTQTEVGDWRAALGAAMEGQPLRAAVDEIATAYALKRKDVYDEALRLKSGR
jgi:16S rRNA (cytidine1402-2'-O)-methyltransferase